MLLINRCIYIVLKIHSKLENTWGYIPDRIRQRNPLFWTLNSCTKNPLVYNDI